MPTYEVIVVGGGHAGIEAALSASRLGCSTLFITMSLDKIGFLSCNPAIGGVGKGQLVREIDALGGEMAKIADASGIQFRQLNASKGPAVRSSRAQVDGERYNAYAKEVVSAEKNLILKEAQVTRLLVKNRTISGVATASGEEFSAKSVIITPGTFLNGLIHIGLKSFPGGRMGEDAAVELSSSLSALGFRLLRFKTGTCARLDRETIDFSKLRIQEGDKPPLPFSLSTKKLPCRQVPCYITYTNKKTHKIIRSGLKESPLFTGVIKGTGVRYCPSIEDKIVRFADRDRHQIFLEPEGLNVPQFYPNGLSTSLPENVQEDFLRSIDGLENVRIIRFGYGIEHDLIEPTQLCPTLETKLVANLYLAGQINGTTGYEEAAAQGLIAGINAALKIKGSPPFILDRSTSYIGVLIDDLVTKGTNEPYRMFTSRVEYRLLLREDNADIRLREKGYKIGLVCQRDYEETRKKQDNIRKGLSYLRSKRLTPTKEANNALRNLNTAPISKAVTLETLLRRPEVTYKNLTKSGIAELALTDDAANQIETEIKYSGFIKREISSIEQFKNLERIKLPQELNYENLPGLSREIAEKLTIARPLNLGQANRISGVTPAAILLLAAHLRQSGKQPKYYKFSKYLRQRFGCRVHKVSIDAGFSCPNKDGTINKNGCIFCDNRGFSFNSRIPKRPIEVQISEGIDIGKNRFKAEKFICYFQAHTNTYAPVRDLRQKYDIVKKFDEIVGISIGTRPDCIDEKILDLLGEYTSRYDVWLELGLQSIHTKTLRFINRGHSFEDFLKAVALIKKAGKIKICAHIIIGLPYEGKDEIMETAKALGRLRLDGIKIHPLYIIKGTEMEALYKKGQYKPMKLNDYVELVTEFLECLPPDTVIQRITSDCPRELLIAPSWILEKARVLTEIEGTLSAKNRFQGRRSINS